jgi:hypothetical protein
MEGSATPTPPSDAFELAGQIGYASYGEIGKKAFEELELCFASKLSPSFKPQLKLRSYTNLNFYWARSYFKNSIMEIFQECLPSGFVNRKITSATTETMFGSMNNAGDKLIAPLFLGCQMCFMPELMTFLGDDMKKKVSTFNEALEGSETTRNLLKFGNAQKTLIDEYCDGKEGLYFDGKTLRYFPNTSFVVGTHPLDNKTYTYLEQSGFFSRFHTIQFRITDSTARELFTGSPQIGEVDVDSLKKQLKTMNEQLYSKASELSGELPDYENLLLPVLQKAYETISVLCEKRQELFLTDTLNPRIKGDIIREVNAYKILCPEVNDEDALKWTLDRIGHFFDFVVNPIIAPSLTQAHTPKIEDCISAVKVITKNQCKKRGEIVETLQKEGFSPQMIGRALKQISDMGLNKSTDYGTYKTE